MKQMEGIQRAPSRKSRASPPLDGAGANARDAALRSRVRTAGLKMVSPESLTITRRKCGKGFLYFDGNGQRIEDAAVLKRIRSLAVPPAYRDVRIAETADAHLQAIGCDDAGRVQYRYHPEWNEVREDRKVERLAAICQALPRIRRCIAHDIRQKGVGRRRALAAVVMLIDRTHIRIGCEDYVHSGRARGAATLLKQNAQIADDRISLTFRGKGGLPIRCGLRCLPLARAMRELGRLKGRRLFQYVDESGAIRRVAAAEVNRYLQEAAGLQVTAKDFRTLAASAAAAERLHGIEPASNRTARRRQIAGVMKDVAAMLANTPAVARKSYVHRTVLAAFREGRLNGLYERAHGGGSLRRGEAVVAALFAEESE